MSIEQKPGKKIERAVWRGTGVLIFGDSIVWGAWDSEGGWVTRMKKYTDKQAIDNQMENYDTIYPLGISGDNTDDLLQRFENELTSRLDEDSNMVVVIAIGINDSQFDISNNKNCVPITKFKSNLIKILKTAKDNTKHTVLVGLSPVDDALLHPMPWKPTHGYSNSHVEKYNNVIKKIAEEKNIPFIDLYKYFSEKDYKKLLSDGLHPNTEGHKVIYTKVLAELKSFGILE